MNIIFQSCWDLWTHTGWEAVSVPEHWRQCIHIQLYRCRQVNLPLSSRARGQELKLWLLRLHRKIILSSQNSEALESDMCDVKKIRLKRRIATRSWRGNQPLNIKIALERLILRLGLPNFRCSFYFILLLVVSLLFRCFFMTSHMPLSSISSSLIFYLSLQRSF